MAKRGITYLGYANARANLRKFGIWDQDRLSHIWIIGKTGTGKSTLLRHIAEQDLENQHGFILLDPHGDLFEEVSTHAENVGRRVTLLDAAKPGWSLDPFSGVRPSQRPLAVAGLIETFKKIWPDGFGARSEHIARNIFWTLMETPGATMLDVPPLFTDRDYRRDVSCRITNPAVHSFWSDEYEKWGLGFRATAIAPIQNKIGAILTDPRLRHVFSTQGKRLSLRQSIDDGEVILVNLSKGVLGDGPSDLLGSILLSRLALAALSRANMPKDQRRFFWVLVDEFQSFGTLHVANMLGELRKYGLGFALAHQSLGQLDSVVRAAIGGNAGTLISFRLGAKDAQALAQELSPTFETDDLLGLPNLQCYLRLMIAGQTSRSFSMDARPCGRDYNHPKPCSASPICSSNRLQEECAPTS